MYSAFGTIGGSRMSQEQEQNKRSQQLENARVGYQVATSLWSYEVGLIWSKFNALLVANRLYLD